MYSVEVREVRRGGAVLEGLDQLVVNVGAGDVYDAWVGGELGCVCLCGASALSVGSWRSG